VAAGEISAGTGERWGQSDVLPWGEGLMLRVGQRLSLNFAKASGSAGDGKKGGCVFILLPEEKRKLGNHPFCLDAAGHDCLLQLST